MTTDPDQTHHQSFWLWVMCLSGVDYFSTLGYQPSIAFDAAGRLAPLATVVLVIVTLVCALPVYGYVAGRSPYGQGSIYILEKLLRGWSGKLLVIAMLGFAATDFIITKTLSAADAAEHVLHNSIWPLSREAVPERVQLIALTMILLLLLGAVFLRGFNEVIGVAVAMVAVYLVLNAIVIGSGLVYLAGHPERLSAWYDQVLAGDWHIKGDLPVSGHSIWVIAALAVLLFPKIALGLSGFETGVAVMPLIRSGKKHGGGDPHGPGAPDPLPGRIRNTRKLLLTAAVIMSAYLITSSLVVSTLIDPDALAKKKTAEGADRHEEGSYGHDHDGQKSGKASGRALAYLAHGEGLDFCPLFGDTFGTIYDISTILILWFAGASAMAGLLNLVPLYLPRYGMAPKWAKRLPPLVLIFTGINLVVTLIFKADVDAQGAAYATGVLMLMTSGAVAAVIEKWRDRSSGRRRVPWFFVMTAIVFMYTTAYNMVEKPDGILIASIFIGVLFVTSVGSRVLRATELRFERFEFADDESREHWNHIRKEGFHILVPHRPGKRDLEHKEASIRLDHRLAADLPMVFVQAQLGDASDFYEKPMMEVRQHDANYLIKISRCTSVAHALAAVGMELAKGSETIPPEFHFDWSEESSVKATLGFLLLGEGNVPWLVHDILKKAEPDVEKRPRVVVG